MDVNLWNSYRTSPRFNRTVRVPDTFIEMHGMPEILAAFDGLYQRVIDKDYGTPAYEELPDGYKDGLPEDKLVYEV